MTTPTDPMTCPTCGTATSLSTPSTQPIPSVDETPERGQSPLSMTPAKAPYDPSDAQGTIAAPGGEPAMNATVFTAALTDLVFTVTAHGLLSDQAKAAMRAVSGLYAEQTAALARQLAEAQQELATLHADYDLIATIADGEEQETVRLEAQLAAHHAGVESQCSCCGWEAPMPSSHPEPGR